MKDVSVPVLVISRDAQAGNRFQAEVDAIANSCVFTERGMSFHPSRFQVRYAGDCFSSLLEELAKVDVEALPNTIVFVESYEEDGLRFQIRDSTRVFLLYPEVRLVLDRRFAERSDYSEFTSYHGLEWLLMRPEFFATGSARSSETGWG